jgi:hypothetical protein
MPYRRAYTPLYGGFALKELENIYKKILISKMHIWQANNFTYMNA